MSVADFPSLVGLGWSVLRTPMFGNSVKQFASGKEARIAFMSAPRYKWGFTFDLLRDSTTFQELKQVIGFFGLRTANLDNFHYTDPSDNAVIAQAGGAGDGATKTFQLVRSIGGYAEPVIAPVTIANLTVAGVAKNNPADYTFSTSTGILTFVVAPGNGAAIVYDITFKWRVRFVDQEIEFENFVYQMWAARKVEIISVKGEVP